MEYDVWDDTGIDYSQWRMYLAWQEFNQEGEDVDD